MNVLIVGGSSDVGISLAKHLNDVGNNVIVTYNNHKKEVDNIEFIKCDIREENSIEDTIKYVINKYNKIDLLINMAAVYYDDEFINLPKDKFMEVLEVNLVGTFLVCQIYSKYINDGMVINIGSTDGIDTFNEYNIFYAASKAGLINMTKSISLVTSNKVICLCPNWLDSASTNEANSNYIKSELERIGQARLITLDEFNWAIDKIINDKIDSGSIIRLDIKGDKLWIEKMQ